MKCFFSLLLLFFLFGCHSTQNYFHEYYSEGEYAESEYIHSTSRKDIKIVDTYYPDLILNKYEKEGYIVIGRSFFNEAWCPRYFAVDTAMEKGASLVIIGIEQTDHEAVTYEYTTPERTYYSGRFYGNAFSGSSQTIPSRTEYRTFDSFTYGQRAYFLAKRK